MTLEKAIEVLQGYLDEQRIFPNSDLANSLKLGIEALNYIHTCRTNPNCFNISPLPGETKT